MENNAVYNQSLVEHHYKLLFLFGVFFLIVGLFNFKSENSRIQDFNKLFIAEGILKFPVSSAKYPSISVQSSNNHLIRLSTYRGYGILKLRKFKNKKVKAWWYSDNLDKSKNPLFINSLYQLEIDGETVIKYNEEIKIIKNYSHKDTFLLMFISFVFLLFATFGYLNALDSRKKPKL